MESSRAEGKRSMRDSKMKEIEEIEEEEEEDEEEEEEEEEEDSGEDNNRKKKALARSGRKGSTGASAQPSCQVEHCTTDMTGEQTYHRRHKVCKLHAKAPVVVVAGNQQRFCQQCSRCINQILKNKRQIKVAHNENYAGSMTYLSLMKPKGVVEGVCLDITSVVAKAHMNLMEKVQIDKKITLSWEVCISQLRYF